MAEYIDREATIEFIRLNYCKDCNSYNGVRCRACSFDDAMLAIEDVPTADVVEVVRCKDCKYFNTEDWNYSWCEAHSYDELIKCKENDFCSYGERRETE